MAEANLQQGAPDAADLPNIAVPEMRSRVDYATLIGLVTAIGLILAAIALGASDASFVNVPALMIVVLGTIAATSISFSGRDLGRAGRIFSQSVIGHDYQPRALAQSLLDIAVFAKKKGVLNISAFESEFNKQPFLQYSLQMAIDGSKPEDIEHILSQDIYTLIERHKRSASIAQRASEVAPAMGLIGTLVGLVQMLADLENPETIGPAMAVALLTTFYGAILGTVVMGPLAVKLEKNARDETLVRAMIKETTVSIARQDNPRKLEMELNAILPPSQRVRYFD
jgi:chemotaxis protein MotA